MSTLQAGSGVPSLEVGGRTFTDLKNLIVLYAECGPTQRYSTLRKAIGNAVAGYAVTSGKTLKIFSAQANVNGTTYTNLRLSYADNDAGVYQTSRSLTNEVNQCGIGSVGQIGVSAASAGINKSALWFEVPTGKYVQIDGAGTTASVTLYCYEE